MLVWMPSEKPSGRDVGKRCRHRAICGVVHREIESAELFNTSRDYLTYGILVGDVGGHCQYATAAIAELGCRLLQPVVAPSSDRHRSARFDECRRHSSADALTAAGDPKPPALRSRIAESCLYAYPRLGCESSSTARNLLYVA